MTTGQMQNKQKEEKGGANTTGLIIQAKKFIKGDWLKRVVFQSNLKYNLYVGISLP